MRKIKANQGLLTTILACVVFGIFAVVVFVQSQNVAAENTKQAQAESKTATCPYMQKASAEKASAMPGSCSELHKQALAAGKMSNEEYAKAEVLLANLNSDKPNLTPDQCRELMAGLGFECNEKDFKACAEKLKSLGFCKETSVEECAAQLAKGLCTPGDSAKCAATMAKGGCCLKAKTIKAGVGGATEPGVTPAVATEGHTDGKAKQCDWTKGKCVPATKTGDQ